MDVTNQPLAAGMRVRVRFEKTKKPMDMDIVGFYCPNPHCDCRETTLFFYKADGYLKTQLFKLVINYEDWHLVSTEIFNDDDDYALIIHEFMEALDDDFKALIVSGKETASSDNHTLRNDIDYTTMTINMLACYPEIYEVNPYEQWLLEVEKKQYIVVDYYCANPKCECREVVLVFDSIKGDKVTGQPALKCKIKFDTGKRTIEERSSGVSLQHAEDMIDELMTLFAGMGLELFKERYARIKKWGKDYLQRELRKQNVPPINDKPKTGRNEPCPCGSGKKFKRCCGR
jgi:hypothetical protein